MCGRYALYDLESLTDEYHVPSDIDMTPNFNVAPTQTMPVVTDRGLELMRWGLIPKWAKSAKVGMMLINARSETVFDKPIWKSAILHRRCLVPANGFYEWQKRPDGKHPFYIHPRDQDLFMFAGVWESWTHEGRDWHSYAILTAAPNREMTDIHDRMPVILHKDDRAQWLAADTRDEIETLLVPYTHNTLEVFEVSRDVNVVKTNDGHLIAPISTTGNY